MLKATETATVINRTTENGSDVYFCHILYGVSWYTQNRYQPETGGYKAAKVHKIRIPLSLLQGYVDPEEYRTATDKTGLWTLAQGDKIVLGEIEQITGAEFSALARTETVCVVNNVCKNLYGLNRHIFVEGG